MTKRGVRAQACALSGFIVLLLAPGAGAESVEDSDITRAVEAEFWTDDAVDANAVDVATAEGVVTLSGTVRSLLASDRAQEIAEGIVGVRAIVNRIEVVGAVRSDAELVQAVEEALLRDPATDSYEITVAASDGAITLAGTVESWAERRLGETVARGVQGVRSVANEIQVRPVSERPDHEIEAEIEARLANDVRVDDFGIEVEVEGGAVTLSGVAGSLAEKRRARGDAWVAGVKSVDDDALEIEWWARDEMRRKSALAPRTDAEIADAVRAALLYDPRVASFEVDVHAENGVVTLSGIVDGPAAQRAAEDDAKNVIGVWRVRNHLKARPSTVPADDVLERRVSRALAEDDFVDRQRIAVNADDGWVHLSGEVHSSWEKRRAELAAERTRGTVRVINQIDYEREWKPRPDWEIRDRIESQLFWSPFVDADEVNVEVRDGVATLTGKVDTWAERVDAAENAWEGGAKDVHNELEVAHRVYGPLATWGWYRP